MNAKWCGLMVLLIVAGGWNLAEAGVVAEGAKVEKLAGGFRVYGGAGGGCPG